MLQTLYQWYFGVNDQVVYCISVKLYQCYSWWISMLHIADVHTQTYKDQCRIISCQSCITLTRKALYIDMPLLLLPSQSSSCKTCHIRVDRFPNIHRLVHLLFSPQSVMRVLKWILHSTCSSFIFNPVSIPFLSF